MTREGRLWISGLADGLTVSRMVIAIALIPASWGLRLSEAALLLSIAWLTDLLDGRLARAAGREGRMGRWDMAADTAVGTGVLIGLTGAGEIPVWLALVAAVVLGSLFMAGNLAAAMLLQLSGYVPLLSILWSQRPAGWWLPFATALMIGVADWRRLVLVNIPNFVRGLVGRFEGP